MKLELIFPFLAWCKLVTKDSLKADFLAGLTGAIIVLPQGLAFATIAGLPPQYGLYTAMVTPVVAALFGSSFHLVSGPTTAISIVVFSTISLHAEPGTPEFISLALTLTFLAGVYQLAFGIARLGALVNFISYTVVIGFTAGAALLIATTQMKFITGIFVPKGESFAHTWFDLFQHTDQFDVYLLLIASVTLVSAIVVRKVWPKLPYLLVGLVAGSIAAMLFQPYTNDIVLVGEIHTRLPPISRPEFSLATIKLLAPDAFAIALLGIIEAISISRAIATNSGQKIDSSQEFIGQGVSNIVGSFFSSYAGSGSFTRSGINYEAGAKTPLSAIFAALALVLIVILIAPLTAYLPVAAMGGIILLVAYNLIDFRHIYQTLTFSKTETSILLTTFFATLFLDLEFAIFLGVLLSLVLFLIKTSMPNIPSLTVDTNPKNGKRRFVSIKRKPLDQCPQLKVIRIDMSAYFGSVNHIQSRINHIIQQEGYKHILIVSSGINFIDLAGSLALAAESDRLKKMGGGLYFVGLKLSVYQIAVDTNFVKKIGPENFFNSKSRAIHYIYRRLDSAICANCQIRIFNECREHPGTHEADA